MEGIQEGNEARRCTALPEISSRLSVSHSTFSHKEHKRVDHSLSHRELESWVQDMRTLIASVEMAKDVASAEATLQRHRERKVCVGL